MTPKVSQGNKHPYLALCVCSLEGTIFTKGIIKHNQQALASTHIDMPFYLRTARNGFFVVFMTTG